MENKRRGSVMLDGDKITLTQVTRVIASGNKSIVAVQGAETISISGDDLNVTEVNLESGRLAATGHVTAVRYSAAVSARGLLKKLFK